MTLHLRPLPDTREFYLAMNDAAYDEWAEASGCDESFSCLASFYDLNHFCGCGRIAMHRFIIDWAPSKSRRSELVAYCSRCFVKAKALHSRQISAEETSKILSQMAAIVKEKRRGN